MKKALLLAVAGLLGLAASAQSVRYVPGEVITSQDELETGYYYMNAFKSNFNDGTDGYIQYVATSEAAGRFRINTSINVTTGLSENDRMNENLVWYIEVSNGTFSIKNVGSNLYFSTHGQQDGDATHPANHNVKHTTGGASDYEIALHQFANVVASATVEGKSENRWFIEAANTLHPQQTNSALPRWSINEQGSNNKISYLNGNGPNCLQVQFTKAERIAPVDVTVSFPQWNGADVTATLHAYTGEDVTSVIEEYADMNGGIKDLAIKSAKADAEDNLTVTEDNLAFVVTGDWNYDFAPNQVYRLCVNPDDRATALRYMLLTGYVKTHPDADEAEQAESLNRIVPERLWFFKPVEGKENTYTLHTLYKSEENPDALLGIKFDTNINGAKSTLVASGYTEFEMIQDPHSNQFYLRVAGSTTAYVADYDNLGLLSIENQTLSEGQMPKVNSLIHIYPLTASDFAALNLDPAIDMPYADNEEFVTAVNDWNAQNIAAALRRIEFMGGEAIIGNNPGQYNNENGDFLEKVQEAKQLLADNEQDVDKLKVATDAIDYKKLTKYNPIKPGYFYRFKNKQSGRYMSCLSGFTTNQTSYMDMVTEDQAKYSNTVFYWMQDGDDKMLVSFDDGRVISTCGANGSPWTPVVSTQTNADGTVNYAAKELDIVQYDGLWHTIHLGMVEKNGVDEHRHFWGGHTLSGKAVNYASAGQASNMNTVSSDPYLWQVELVTELPVPLYNDVESTSAWASVYSPWPLEIENGEVVAYSAKYNGTAVEHTEIGDVIPANQSTLLEYKGNAITPDDRPDHSRDGINYIYMKVLYDQPQTETQGLLYDNVEEDETTPAVDVEKQDLNGGILALAKDSSMKYFTLHETESNNFREHDAATDYVPGFKAHLAIPADQIPASEENVKDGKTIIPIKAANDNTDGISEVEATAVKAVYDLQGRKLAAPSKGINIVNGVKVLVK